MIVIWHLVEDIYVSLRQLPNSSKNIGESVRVCFFKVIIYLFQVLLEEFWQHVYSLLFAELFRKHSFNSFSSIQVEVVPQFSIVVLSESANDKYEYQKGEQRLWNNIDFLRERHGKVWFGALRLLAWWQIFLFLSHLMLSFFVLFN